MARPFIGIIDSGVGNHQSVLNALNYLGLRTVTSNRPAKLEKAAGLVLPGVGAFGEMMAGLQRAELIAFLQEKAGKTPLLGICLGMQVLAEGSEEDPGVKGLGLVPGFVRKFSDRFERRVPHVGWNNCSTYRADSPLFSNYKTGQPFYFDHSFYVEVEETFVSSRVSYGEEVVASIEKGSLFGVQFHPEKSQWTGLRLLRGFANFSGVS